VPPKITSRHNALVQRARAARAGREPELLFIEGTRLSTEALKAGLRCEAALYTEQLAQHEAGARLLAELEGAGVRLTEVSEAVSASVADTNSPQGIVLLAKRPHTNSQLLETDATALVVIMHGINNPANAGALVRVAEAAGASGVIATVGTTDLFAPKALRGAMGSTFRLPLWLQVQFDEALRWCAARGISTVATDLRATRRHTDIDWTRPRAIIMGAEASGLTQQEAADAVERIRIPMRPPVESLNVSTALAIVLYEAARQRGLD
jgi:RNA methyltransferase, TrmH family